MKEGMWPKEGKNGGGGEVGDGIPPYISAGIVLKLRVLKRHLLQLLFGKRNVVSRPENVGYAVISSVRS